MSFKKPSAKDLAAEFKITEAEAQAYMTEFLSMDSNKDGKISTEELRTSLQKYGCVVSSEQAKTMVKFADVNNDDKIDLVEFMALVIRTIKSSKVNIEQEAMEAFKHFDQNKDGYVSAKELQVTMTKLGSPLTEKEAEKMLKTFDKNKDGKLDFKEFLAVWKQLFGQQ